MDWWSPAVPVQVCGRCSRSMIRRDSEVARILGRRMMRATMSRDHGHRVFMQAGAAIAGEWDKRT